MNGTFLYCKRYLPQTISCVMVPMHVKFFLKWTLPSSIAYTGFSFQIFLSLPILSHFCVYLVSYAPVIIKQIHACFVVLFSFCCCHSPKLYCTTLTVIFRNSSFFVDWYFSWFRCCQLPDQLKILTPAHQSVQPRALVRLFPRTGGPLANTNCWLVLASDKVVLKT